MLDAAAKTIYPDYTRDEHEKIYADHAYPKLIADGNALAVVSDGKAIAIYGCRKLGESESGRPTYEFTKASTLNDERFRGKGLNRRMKKIMYEETVEKSPDALFVGASRNKKYLESLESRGWHVVEVDDAHEAAKVLCGNDPYSELLKAHGYKAIYLDPKVDNPKWDDNE